MHKIIRFRKEPREAYIFMNNEQNEWGGGLLFCFVFYKNSDLIRTHYRKMPEKAMAPHSSVLAWRIPGAGKSGGLPSMGSHRVGHD